MSFRSRLIDASTALGVPLSAEQVDQCAAHWSRVADANRRFNLTRITDPEDAAVKHYADALSVVAWARTRAARIGTVLDVGAGPGLPALALAVAEPTWHVTAVDATAKKADFVADCAATLGLSNLAALHRHTDHWLDAVDVFDLITFRAVGALEACIATGHRRLAPGGTLICFKSARLSDEERTAGLAAARRHHLRALDDFPYALTTKQETLRRLLVIYQRC
jgi:16S rRNA (guanine527-N7)-methyltransferase